MKINVPPKITKRTKTYSPEPGDEFVKLGDIGPEHVGRIFEARFEDGTGVLGTLRDANHYLLEGVVAIRFAGEKLGIFDLPGTMILLKPEGTQMPVDITTGNPLE